MPVESDDDHHPIIMTVSFTVRWGGLWRCWPSSEWFTRSSRYDFPKAWYSPVQRQYTGVGCACHSTNHIKSKKYDDMIRVISGDPVTRGPFMTGGDVNTRTSFKRTIPQTHPQTCHPGDTPKPFLLVQQRLKVKYYITRCLFIIINIYLPRQAN